MQRMLAAELREEAAILAHTNAIRKRQADMANQFPSGHDTLFSRGGLEWIRNGSYCTHCGAPDKAFGSGADCVAGRATASEGATRHRLGCHRGSESTPLGPAISNTIGPALR